MKAQQLLFIGEGKNDVGLPSHSRVVGPYPAGGVIPTLAHRILPDLRPSLSLRWVDVPRLPRDPASRKHGYEEKARAAIDIAKRAGHSIQGVVLSTDGDTDHGARREQLQVAADALRARHASLPVVPCVPASSIEAFTLGAPEAIAAELDRPEAQVKACYPHGIHVEALREKSGKPEHRPKALLESVAALAHRTPDTAFRVAVAERTDPAKLAVACPCGFAPFRAALLQLRAAAIKTQ